MFEKSEPAVFVVDDDALMRSLVRRLVESIGLHAELFATARDFLDRYDPSRPGCLVTDVRMPGMTGLELLESISSQESLLPVILMTGHASVPMAVQAMKSDAVDVIEKPFSNQELLSRIRNAVALNAERRQFHSYKAALTNRVSNLTPREKEVMDLVVSGFANKQIAHHLDLSEKTVEAHRSRLMRKVGARSLAELVRLGVAADPERLLGVTTAPLEAR